MDHVSRQCQKTSVSLQEMLQVMHSTLDLKQVKVACTASIPSATAADSASTHFSHVAADTRTQHEAGGPLIVHTVPAIVRTDTANACDEVASDAVCNQGGNFVLKEFANNVKGEEFLTAQTNCAACNLHTPDQKNKLSFETTNVQDTTQCSDLGSSVASDSLTLK